MGLSSCFASLLARSCPRLAKDGGDRHLHSHERAALNEVLASITNAAGNGVPVPGGTQDIVRQLHGDATGEGECAAGRSGVVDRLGSVRADYSAARADLQHEVNVWSRDWLTGTEKRDMGEVVDVYRRIEVINQMIHDIDMARSTLKRRRRCADINAAAMPAQ